MLRIRPDGCRPPHANTDSTPGGETAKMTLTSEISRP